MSLLNEDDPKDSYFHLKFLEKHAQNTLLHSQLNQDLDIISILRDIIKQEHNESSVTISLHNLPIDFRYVYHQFFDIPFFKLLQHPQSNTNERLSDYLVNFFNNLIECENLISSDTTVKEIPLFLFKDFENMMIDILENNTDEKYKMTKWGWWFQPCVRRFLACTAHPMTAPP